jgi:hypothetical protein
MKYKIRLNEDPELEVEANHCETNGDQVILEDTGTFNISHKEIVINKIELIGEDGDVHAMRKLPSHLTYTLTPNTELTFQYKLTVLRPLILK